MFRDRLAIAYNRQKFYVDNTKRDLEFEIGDKVYLKISPMTGTRLGDKGKLSLRYIGPYEVLQCVWNVSNELNLPNDLAFVHPMFHVSMLKKYLGDPTSIFLFKG